MTEIELKGAVRDAAALRRRLGEAGAVLMLAGRLEDRRYDTIGRALTARDHVLRLRTLRTRDGTSSTTVDWKGATGEADGFKVREELSTATADAGILDGILSRLGFIVIREIDRDIEQYALHGTTIRLETYPRMDTLLEVEGEPAGIERAITVAGLPRADFTSERLPAFVARYEARTGERAALCDRELLGDYRYSTTDG